MRNGGSGSPRIRASVPGRRAWLLAVLLAASVLPLATPADAGLQITFEGGGWGHSVGMSQYGAYGMALEGYTWQEILTHYFSGASPAVAQASLVAEPIWVGLAQEQSRLELTVVPTGATPARPVTFTLAGAALVALPGQTVVVEVLAGGTCRVTAPAGSLTGPCSIDADWDGWDEVPTTALQLEGCWLPDWNAPGGTVWKPCRYAYGSLHARPDNDTITVNLSLEVGIEDYILGISESPYAWGTSGGRAALEAQAVAARSYALYRVIVRGDPASRPWCHCQLYDTTVDQFYVGWGHATQPWLDAVAATVGRVMVHPSATLDGSLIPIQTFYASSTFGWTENSEDGFAAYVPYLRAVDDHWGILPEVGNPQARWTRSFDADALAALLPGLATITGAQVTRCSETGAALEITFTGEGGPRAFSTRDLRSRLSLPSMQVISVGAPPSGSPACDGYVFAPMEPGGPVSLAGVSVDDDDTDDSAGDGDGVLECGESAEVTTNLVNQGGDLQSVTATLSSADSHVSILWNTASAFPDLPGGGTTANSDDWDLAVSPDTPDGHTIHLTLHVSAANGGPWDVEVPLPVGCGSTFTGVLADPGDLNGDGVSEVAVAFAQSGQPARLRVRDGATGAIIFTRPLGRASYVPIAAATVPNYADSPAAEVAVLLTGPGLPGRIAVVDAATGERISTMALTRTDTYLDLTAVPGVTDRSAPMLAALSVRGDGTTRAVLRDGASGARLGVVGFGRALRPVAVAGFSSAEGEALVAVLGNRSDGRLVAPVRRAADRTRVLVLGLSPGLTAVDLAFLPDVGEGALLVAVATTADRGTTRLISADPDTGQRVGSFSLPDLSSPLALAPLGNIGGGPGLDVAVLGRAQDGAATLMMVDPATADVPAVARFAGGFRADEVSSLGADQSLAVLGLTPAGSPLVIVRRAATGAEISSFRVP